jgi:hypothetical protein
MDLLVVAVGVVVVVVEAYSLAMVFAAVQDLLMPLRMAGNPQLQLWQQLLLSCGPAAQRQSMSAAQPSG